MTENVENGFIKKASVSSFSEISKDQALFNNDKDLEDTEETQEEETES